uniref:Putative conserved secreted protein n=1 Tax=Amblyomma tuberculatum TaxID=48802 RepID=A0A6M2E452_9ACAR
MINMTSLSVLALLCLCCSGQHVHGFNAASRLQELQVPAEQLPQNIMSFPDFSQQNGFPPQLPSPPLPPLQLPEQGILTSQWPEQHHRPSQIFPPIQGGPRRFPRNEVPACRSIRCGERRCSDKFKRRPRLCRRGCTKCVCRWPLYRNNRGQCVMPWQCRRRPFFPP